MYIYVYVYVYIYIYTYIHTHLLIYKLHIGLQYILYIICIIKYRLTSNIMIRENRCEQGLLCFPFCLLGCNSASTCACVLSCFSHAWLFMTPWTVALQVPLNMGFSRQEYWSGLPCPPPRDLPVLRIKPTSPVSPALQVDSWQLSHWGSLYCICKLYT